MLTFLLTMSRVVTETICEGQDELAAREYELQTHMSDPVTQSAVINHTPR